MFDIGRAVAAGCVMTLVLGSTVACNRGSGEDVVGLITKTDTNPFFVQMKKGAQSEARKQGLEFRVQPVDGVGQVLTDLELLLERGSLRPRVEMRLKQV